MPRADGSTLPVSVVIPTHNRCEDCQRAAASALEQVPPPVEVLVCDDGSTDGTQAAFERWQHEEPRLRYLRLEESHGTPAHPRNLGAKIARGEWVAFLDDDDRWLPGKLAAQWPLMSDGRFDVVATDAVRSNGRRYFADAGVVSYPTSSDVERDNPIVVSSSVVRRSVLMDVGAFDEGRAIVADYDLWLRLADLGARFAVVDAPLVEYEDAGMARMSVGDLRMQLWLLRVRARRWLASPTNSRVLISLVRELYFTIALAGRAIARRLLPPRT